MRPSRPAFVLALAACLAGVVASRDALALKQPPCTPSSDATHTWTCSTLGLTQPHPNYSVRDGVRERVLGLVRQLLSYRSASLLRSSSRTASVGAAESARSR